MRKLCTRALLTWVLFIPIAICNGVIRESVYKTYTGDLLAHQISTVIAIVAFIALAYATLKRAVAGASRQQLLLVGCMWLSMTVVFEFGFGHYVDGASWKHLLADYNLLDGHVWGLFLLSIFITPLIVKALAGRGGSPNRQ